MSKIKKTASKKKKLNQDNERYQITPKGALSAAGYTEDECNHIIDCLELCARRIAGTDGIPAIVFEEWPRNFHNSKEE